MAIRDLGQTNTRVVCKQCHNGVGLPNVADISHGGGSGEGGNAHHRTRASGALPAPGATVTNYVPAEETGANPLTIKAPSWAGAVGSGTGPFLGLGDLSTGMDCADCHVFNGTAHNW